ncbi:hypothetical protein BDZ91DRAFT_738979 [Kalaharituber pfeilii]|nr:hypothetical protein BDZ91DRAFT_738979 [Kalaharituber pfeilii]
MPKTAKLRKNRTPSIHSRAAKRAASPSLNLDKSLLNLPPPLPRRHPLATMPQKLDKAIAAISMRSSGGATGAAVGGNYAGVKKRGQKQLSAKQRRRKELGVVMAERVAGRLERKVKESVGRGKVVGERKGNWDELNSKIEVPVDAGADMMLEMKIK